MDAKSTLDLRKISIRSLGKDAPIHLFRCGVPEIDQWAQVKCRPLQDINRTKTFCAFLDGGSSVQGFYALSFDSKDTERLNQAFKRFPNVPVVYLTYIAVLRSVQRQGLGSFLLVDALRRAYGVSQHIGFHGVALRSLNDDTTRLYKKYGFVAVDTNVNPLMILPVQALNELFEVNSG